jgi:hypothetical protein
MRQSRQQPYQTEYLCGLYRALGLSEQTLERAIKASKQHRPPRQSKGLSEPGRSSASIEAASARAAAHQRTKRISRDARQ